jgi:c-di-GMP-binding flagellar brake protein YcgR
MNLASRNYQEKRDFLRMNVDTPVEVILEQQHAQRGQCHNLSGGGMLISLASPLPIGTQMEVTLSSNHGHSPVLKAVTRVQRVENLNFNRTESCLMGLKIIEVLE